MSQLRSGCFEADRLESWERSWNISAAAVAAWRKVALAIAVLDLNSRIAANKSIASLLLIPVSLVIIAHLLIGLNKVGLNLREISEQAALSKSLHNILQVAIAALEASLALDAAAESAAKAHKTVLLILDSADSAGERVDLVVAVAHRVLLAWSAHAVVLVAAVHGEVWKA